MPACTGVRRTAAPGGIVTQPWSCIIVSRLSAPISSAASAGVEQSMSLKDAVSALRSLKAELEASRSAKAELENAYRGVLEVCLSGARFSTAAHYPSPALSRGSRVVFLCTAHMEGPSGEGAAARIDAWTLVFSHAYLWYLPVVSEPIIREFQLQ